MFARQRTSLCFCTVNCYTRWQVHWIGATTDVPLRTWSGSRIGFSDQVRSFPSAIHALVLHPCEHTVYAGSLRPAVERIWHTYDSPGQVLVLAFGIYIKF